MKEPLFKRPKKSELPKNYPIEKKQHIVYRQNQYIIKHGSPHWHFTFASKKMQHRFFNEQNSKSRTGKNDQNDDYLKCTLHFPPFSKFMYPIHFQLICRAWRPSYGKATKIYSRRSNEINKTYSMHHFLEFQLRSLVQLL